MLDASCYEVKWRVLEARDVDPRGLILSNC